MKIPGSTMGKYLSLIIFKIILVLFIIYTAIKLVVVILVESISGLSAHQEENLEKFWGKNSFSRTILSLHKTKGQCNYEETKQLFLNNVLIESLDDGSPAYYNSNILGRYMRKDYGNFGRDPSDNS